ncbi:MAG: RraA family protein [Chloroflexota bacterium]
MSEGPAVLGRPEPIPAGWIEVYRQLPPALLGHVIEDGFVDPRIRALVTPFPGTLVVGTAVTVRLPDGDLEAVVPAVDLLQPGDVLVIDHGGRESIACWGELTSLAAKARGCIAVIVDGAVANVAALTVHQLPTFARGVTAAGGRRLGRGGAVNVPVQCGGVAVHPGDLVVADDDGIVVVPPPRLDDVWALARPVLERMPLARAWIERGGLLGEIGDLDAAGVHQRLQERGWS